MNNLRDRIAKVVCDKYHGTGTIHRPCTNCFITADQILTLLHPLSDEEIFNIILETEAHSDTREWDREVGKTTIEIQEARQKNYLRIREIAHALSSRLSKPPEEKKEDCDCYMFGYCNLQTGIGTKPFTKKCKKVCKDWKEGPMPPISELPQKGRKG